MTDAIRDDLEGNFSFESLICSLFQSDIGLLGRAHDGQPAHDHDGQPAHDHDGQPAHDMDDSRRFAEQAARAARTRTEAIPLEPRHANPLWHRTRDDPRIFHERVHYWQLIATPMLQLRFINYLEKLRVEVAQLGGYYQTIFSQQPNALATREECEEMLASADAHFKPFAVTEDMLRLWPNRISDDPHTSMLFLERPFQVGPDRVLSLPAYAALLGFRPPHRPVCFPFTGKHLLEAAAYLSELLIQGRPLPRPEHLDDPQDEQYVGPWEFWRRLHGGRYAKEQDLALAFLAAVDLTLVTDVIEPQILDDEQQYEVYSIPYRFGKLAFRAQGIPPLRAGKRNVAAAVVRFQEELCRYSSWLPPTTVARKMAVFLTRCLLKAFAQMGGVGLDAPTAQAISWVLRAPIAEAAEHFDIVERTWRGFPRVGLTTNRLLGQHTVGMMLNACVDRIRHPGELAVPHTYAASLIDRFPFPFIMADGHYYYDVAGGLPDERRDDQPFPLAPEDLWADCVGLMAISPLQRGMNRCGFLEEAVQCAYVQFGLGCPHQALTEAQRQLRLQTGLDDWCHWTCKSLVLHTAAPDVLQRWRERWQVPLPTLYRGPTGPGDQPAGSSAQAVPDE